MDVSLIGEWSALLLRWLHVIAGIAWIGASFYFIALDAGLKRTGNLEPGVGGEAWQVHGGGFYRIQKYLVAPSFLPAELTWFKWEAYATWISGFALLVLLYYFQPSLYLIDRSVADLSPAEAVAIAAGSLPLGWLAYNALCKSPLGRDLTRLSIAGLVLLVLVIWGFTQVFSGRGAFMQIGALVGTMMVGNVFFIIIPNQRKIVAALLAGETPDPALGFAGKQRSLHNNYLTLPVVFLMVSNHYPFLSANPFSWVIVSGVFLVGFLVRHFFNVRHTGRTPQWWLLPGAAAVMLALIVATQPPGGGAAASTAAAAAPAPFTEVRAIVSERCAICHAAKPRFEGLDAAPKGIMFDTPELIERYAPQIYAQAVVSRAMPLNNATEITEDERRALASWFNAGARMDE
jgi:uncharacterized membrane protein